MRATGFRNAGTQKNLKITKPKPKILKSIGFTCIMKKILIALFLIFSLILTPNVFAKQGHMKLLAVRETESGAMEGGIADLYLEIKPGSGRVFLETFPLTKTDTQMSARFGKAIACDLIDKPCDDVDFFYTITSGSAIVAGPSAGAAIAVLTVALLEDLKINEAYAITGTINSGGLIGPVGGLKAKVEAAKKIDLTKVFIPVGELIVKIDNNTVDLKNLSKQLDIEIIEVSSLSEAVKHFTGREIGYKYKDINISQEYTSTMKSLAKNLCDRSSLLRAQTSRMNYSINVTAINSNALNLSIRGKEAFEKQTFYSAASYCFGSNVEYSTLLMVSKNLSKQSYSKEVDKLKKEINNFRKKIDAMQKKTITDLESYIVVKERLAEAEESADQVLELLNRTNRTERIARALAYASERINSANSWASFLGKNGKEFVLNKEVLRKSCQSKISEADERKQYVELYFPGTLDSIKKQIDQANYELEKENYEVCLSTASKAKAEVDVILSAFGVDAEQYNNLVERKLEIVKNKIAEQTSKGIFPILSYSYYEYANSLKDSDIFSAMLYSEYALELGNLDIYLKESYIEGPEIRKRALIDEKILGAFAVGIAVGVLAVFLFKKPVKAKRKK